jgi:hypothetical protein
MALYGGEWSASRPGRFTPRYPLDRRLGGPQDRSGLGNKSIKTHDITNTKGELHVLKFMQGPGEQQIDTLKTAEARAK